MKFWHFEHFLFKTNVFAETQFSVNCRCCRITYSKPAVNRQPGDRRGTDEAAFSFSNTNFYSIEFLKKICHQNTSIFQNLYYALSKLCSIVLQCFRQLRTISDNEIMFQKSFLLTNPCSGKKTWKWCGTKMLRELSLKDFVNFFYI